MPNYFSETNCRASATIVPDGGKYISVATLTVGGEVVEYYWQVPGEPIPLSVELAVTFDSSHFPYDTDLLVEVEAYDNLGGYYYDCNSSTVVNKASCFNNFDFVQILGGNASPGVSVIMSQLNHWVDHYNDPLGNATTYQNSIVDSNVVFIASHGDAPGHYTNTIYTNEHVYTPAGFISQTHNYFFERAAAIGIGTPPFNDGSPPFNLAYLNCCYCLAGPDWDLMLWPQLWYDEVKTDQCVIGWKVLFPAEYSELISNTLFDSLKNGNAAQVALDDVRAVLTEENMEVKYPGGFWRPFQYGDIGFVGDDYTRITSVYTGSAVPPIGWYR